MSIDSDMFKYTKYARKMLKRSNQKTMQCKIMKIYKDTVEKV